MNCTPCDDIDSSTPEEPTGEPLSAACECVLNILKPIIGDLDGDISDTRLLSLVSSAAYLVHIDLSCCSAVDKPDDPQCEMDCEVLLAFPSFLVLVALRAACMHDVGSARAKAEFSGLRAACGPANFSVSSGSGDYGLIFRDGACGQYKEMMRRLCFECPLAKGICKQVLTKAKTCCEETSCGCDIRN